MPVKVQNDCGVKIGRDYPVAIHCPRYTDKENENKYKTKSSGYQ